VSRLLFQLSPRHRHQLAPPIPSVPVNGNFVNNVIDKESAVTAFGCSEGDNVLRRAFDATTEKFICTKPAGATEHGIVVTPSQASIVNSLRVYAHNNCPNCDAVTYRVEGRVDSGNAWVDIGSGSLPWFDTVPIRNSRWLDISSSYESGDTALNFTEVSFPTNDQAFAEYKLSFDQTREPNAAYLQFSEVELPGTLVGGYTAPPTAVTSQPTPQPTVVSQPTGTPTSSVSFHVYVMLIAVDFLCHVINGRFLSPANCETNTGSNHRIDHWDWGFFGRICEYYSRR